MMGSRLGDVVSEMASSDDPTLAQLHAIAVQIVGQRAIADSIVSMIANADYTADQINWSALASAWNRMAELKAQLVAMSQDYRNQNPYTMGVIDRMVLAIGNEVESAMGVLPNVIAAVPDAVARAAGRVLGSAGSSLVSGLWPWVVLGGVALWAVGSAERTRTYRKYVA